MSFDFTPLSDAELDALNVVPEGQYRFEVVKSMRRTSKAGNPMSELTLKFWDIEGRERTCFDYLVFSQIGLNIRKIKHFADSVGLSEEYKKGSLPEDFVGLSGAVYIGVQDERPKPEGGFYPKKNVVLDYISDNKSNAVSSKKEDEFKDDDLPF